MGKTQFRAAAPPVGRCAHCDGSHPFDFVAFFVLFGHLPLFVHCTRMTSRPFPPTKSLLFEKRASYPQVKSNSSCQMPVAVKLSTLKLAPVSGRASETDKGGKLSRHYSNSLFVSGRSRTVTGSRSPLSLPPSLSFPYLALLLAPHSLKRNWALLTEFRARGQFCWGQNPEAKERP